MALGTTNITTNLIATTLGEVAADVGTLCKSTQINKWSKNKPVKFEKISGIDDNDLKSINYGFTFPRTNVFNVIASQKWTYEKPTGGATSPFRLGDFRGYLHTATKLIGCPSISEINIFENASDTITFTFPATVVGQLKMSDFTGVLANQYLGLVIVTSGGTKYVITSTSTVSSGGSSITLDLTTPPFQGISVSDTFTFYYVLSNILVSTISSNNTAYITDNLFIPIPNLDTDTSYNEVLIKNQYQGVFGIDKITDQISGTLSNIAPFIGFETEDSLYYITSNGSVFFKVTITNSTAGSISFQRQHMNVVYNTNFWGYARNEVLAVYDSSWNNVTTDLTISASGSLTLYMGTNSTLFRDGTSPTATITSPATGARISPSVNIFYKGSRVFNISNFRFEKS